MVLKSSNLYQVSNSSVTYRERNVNISKYDYGFLS